MVAQLVKCRMYTLLAIVGVSSNPTSVLFGRFFFIIGGKGWAHPKVFRLPHPLNDKMPGF